MIFLILILNMTFKIMYINLQKHYKSTTTTRKKINSDRYSEALQWNRRRSSIWRPLLRRFWTAAANKQILTGHPRRFKCVPQRIRKNINANFILPLYYSLSRTFSCSSPSHHFITTARPLVLKKRMGKNKLWHFSSLLLDPLFSISGGGFSISGDETCSTPCFQISGDEILIWIETNFYNFSRF
jgi:hypothetical protein